MDNKTGGDALNKKPSIFMKQKIFPYAIFVASCWLLLGCAPVVAPLAVGTVYLNKERASIYVTDNENDIKGCEFIKQVQASSLWGGLAFQDKALEKTISDLTHDSVEAGANVLLIRSRSKTFNGSSSKGDAYRCPDVRNAPAPSDSQPSDKSHDKNDKTS